MDKITGNISPIDNIKGNISIAKNVDGNIVSTSIISGNISDAQDIDGQISKTKTISGNITYGNGGDSTVPIYDGDYVVTPLAFEEQLLSTKGKKMTGDVLVKEVPYFETSNLSGGVTVYIAGKIEMG